MNKHAKLAIIAKIQELPNEEQGSAARVFETVDRIDWATKTPYIIGLWCGIAGLVIFPAIYNIDNLSGIDGYLIGVVVASLCFFGGAIITKLFYFSNVRSKAMDEFHYLLSNGADNHRALSRLRTFDVGLRLMIDRYLQEHDSHF